MSRLDPTLRRLLAWTAAAVTALTVVPSRATDAPAAPFDTIVLPVEVPARGAPKSWKMGFSLDDAAYLRAIPRAARTVRLYPGLLGDDKRFRPAFRSAPAMKTQAPAEVVRFRSDEAMPGEGTWVPRKIWTDDVGDYEQWWLQDAKGFIAVISIHKATGQTYFFEVRGTHDNPRANATYDDGDKAGLVAAGNDYCFACHPSGLRKIQPRSDDPEVDWSVLDKLNLRIKSRGFAKFGTTVDPGRYGKPLAGSCGTCHDNKRRGALYPIHVQPIHYKLRTLHSMPPPPNRPLDKAETDKLMAHLGAQSEQFFGGQCDSGDVSSCKLLGVLFADGTGGLPVDKPKALALFDKACAAGDGVGCMRAGLMHETGDGVPPAPAKAAKAFQRGCDLKQSEGCRRLQAKATPAAAAASVEAQFSTHFEDLRRRGKVPEGAYMGPIGSDGSVEVFRADGSKMGKIRVAP